MNKIATLRLAVAVDALDSPEAERQLRRAAEILQAGGTVAFPTETVYGLGANALDADAVQRIFAAKQRPNWDPLIVHVAREEQVRQVAAAVPEQARRLMKLFWPGPLTLLLPKSEALPSIVTAGKPKVGVRMPSHPVARRLIDLAQLPIAAPSANSFGRTSPTRAEFVLEDLDGRIDAVVDSGSTFLGLESSVVDVCDDPPVLYRPGMITFEQLQSICPGIVRYQTPKESSVASGAQPSPGVGLKHYAPRARLILFAPDKVDGAHAQARKLEAQGERVGIMVSGECAAEDLRGAAGREPPASKLVYRWGGWGDQEELARRLYAGLRELDAAGATVILCPLPTERGIGGAIRDRLLKAARR